MSEFYPGHPITLMGIISYFDLFTYRCGSSKVLRVIENRCLHLNEDLDGEGGGVSDYILKWKTTTGILTTPLREDVLINCFCLFALFDKFFLSNVHVFF